VAEIEVVMGLRARSGLTVILILLFLPLTFLLSGCAKPAPEPQIEMAAVPDLAGLTVLEAERVLSDAGLKVGETAESFSDTVPAGTIISSSPCGGRELEAGSAIALTVSKGPEMLAVPALIGSGEADALAALQAQGFAVEVLRESDDSVGAGLVCAMEPVPATAAKRGSKVILTVSLGSAYITCGTCGGDGEIIAEVTCPDCGGSGVCYT
jgi:serine/threonine-protein kinase